MTYIPSFMKIGSGIQKLMGGTHRHTDSMVVSFFFQNKGNRLKMRNEHTESKGGSNQNSKMILFDIVSIVLRSQLLDCYQFAFTSVTSSPAGYKVIDYICSTSSCNKQRYW
jgi:hypothetical protein